MRGSWADRVLPGQTSVHDSLAEALSTSLNSADDAGLSPSGIRVQPIGRPASSSVSSRADPPRRSQIGTTTTAQDDEDEDDEGRGSMLGPTAKSGWGSLWAWTAASSRAGPSKRGQGAVSSGRR